MAKKISKKKNTKKRKKSQKKSWMWFKFVFKLGIVFFLLIAGYVSYCFITLPDIEDAVSRTRTPSTTIIAENGNEIYTFGNNYAQVIYLKDLPDYVPQAIIDVEDKRFYSHFGFDIIGFARASVVNLIKRRYAQGASTITQQVAKNLFLTPQKSIKRKVQELLIAFWLENKFSKEQILTLYLNRVYLGAGTYGIEAASNRYFGKNSADLSLKEAATLAGMLKAPSRYNPIANPDLAQSRAEVVLNLMYENGSITEEQLNKAIKEPYHDSSKYKVEGARHFADMVYAEVNTYIAERNQDLYVSTTLDQDLQQKAEWILKDAIQSNKNKNVSNGAVVILDYNGAIKALVGGVDYNKSQFNIATQALRQSGSVFKPFVYIRALEQGFTPNDIIEDKTVKIKTWQPQNYDKKTYGLVSLNDALIKSLNLATINLSWHLESKDIIKTARKMGITTNLKNNPALVLGVDEVKLIDIASAYLSIANGGYAAWPYAISEIYTKDGIQLYQHDMSEQLRVLDENVVSDISKMLENVIKYGTGKNASLPAFAAGKTGTTQDYKDAWFVGWTSDYVCAVWVGNDDNSPMDKITGGNLPAQIWKKIMLNTLDLESISVSAPQEKFEQKNQPKKKKKFLFW
ncbi:MAG: PBP1A family penicillin-binding protein [Alphaproteobacteria bacterium]|nr:PBP1A family penicillin-binding protein [Alphaproteobacteria bacterium]